MSNDTDRAAWLEQRRSGLGGTDSAKVIGVSTWGDAFTVFQEKMGLVAKPLDNPAMRVGRIMEPVIAKEFAEKYKVELDKGCFLRDPKIDWLIGTTDYHLRGVRAGLDCKMPQSPRAIAKWGKEDSDEVPLEYFSQAQHYLRLTGWDVWYLAAMLPAERGGEDEVETRRYIIEPDKEFIEMLVEECGAFWVNHIKAGIEPAPTSNNLAREYLKARHPSETAELLEPTAELRKQVEAYRIVRDRAAELVKSKEDFEAYFKFLIGDATGFDFGDAGKITWKKSRDGSEVDWQMATREILSSLKLTGHQISEASEIISKYTTIKEGTRRFNFGLKEKA